jgi:predicted dehydrogenase
MGHPEQMEKSQLGVGMIGYAFMGKAHSQAWRSAGRFFDLPLAPQMSVVCGRDPGATQAAADQFGWAGAETDWRRVIERDDVQLVDICTPGDTHAEIAIAALEAGKHVLCEKPLANSVAEAELMVAAAAAARARGVHSMVGFNYRRVPAIALARRLVAEGRLGRIRHVRAQYLQDWIVDPQFPLVWRLQADRAGSGALGDIAAHIVDATQYIAGDRLAGVSGLTETFIKERPLQSVSTGGGLAAQADAQGPTGMVTVDDAALFIGRFEGGALASFEATRFATGRKNAIRIELNGSLGSLAFDFESMNELQVHDATVGPEVGGFTRVLVTEPEHPYMAAWWPPGHGIGYEHSFTHEIVDLVRDLAAGVEPSPSFEDGLQIQHVLAAVQASAADESRWQPVSPSFADHLGG